MMKKNIIDFTQLLSSIQTIMNNSTNAAIDISFNEILYGFKMLKTANLLDNDLTKTRAEDGNPSTIIKKKREILRKKTKNSLILFK